MGVPRPLLVMARNAGGGNCDGSKAAYDRLNLHRSLAEAQGGHVTHRQLIALGLSRHAIAHRLARGALIRICRGVYAVGHLPTNPIDRAHGALLICGPRSTLSHGSAASLWGIWSDWRYPLELTVANDRRPPGLRVHHSRTLTRADITLQRGLAVTTPARTILDLAPRLSDRRLLRVINDLRLRNLVTVGALRRLTERLPARPGASRIRAVIDAAHAEPTRSSFEDDWVRFARRHRLPAHEMNVHVCGHRVDVLFLPNRLIVELDGWDTHRTKQAFAHDRKRDAEILARTGIPTVRITYDAFQRGGAEHARMIRRIMSSPGGSVRT